MLNLWKDRVLINLFYHIRHKVLLKNPTENCGKEKENVQSRIPDNI